MTGAWIWIVVAILGFLALLFGITNTWGIVFFILFLVFLGVGIYFSFKDKVKFSSEKSGQNEVKFA